MIRRHADLTLYRDIFKSKDFIRVALGAALIPPALALDQTGLALIPEISPGDCLLVLSVLVNGLPIVLGAVRGLLKKRINVDELVSMALLACVINGNFLEAAVVSAIMVFGAWWKKPSATAPETPSRASSKSPRKRQWLKKTAGKSPSG
nr:cation-transporting P-type ATPase [Desulfobacula sp.]